MRGWPVRGRLVVAAGLLLAACGPGEGSVFALEEGTCFDDPEETQGILEVEVVPCDEPHDNEVFATLQLTDPGDLGAVNADDTSADPNAEEGDGEDLDEVAYPGGAAVEGAALDRCTTAFPEPVAERYRDTDLVIGVLTPSEASWQDGDREVVCFVSSPDGVLTGSLLEDQG